jgi:hypothetical protein
MLLYGVSLPSARAGLSDLGIAAEPIRQAPATAGRRRQAPTRRSRSRTGTKQDRSTLRVVDGSQSRGYNLFAADTAASTAVQLIHRKRLTMIETNG